MESQVDTSEYAYVGPGEFTRGGYSAPDEGPPGSVYTDAYWIAKTAVSNRQYGEFVAATGWRMPPLLHHEVFGRPDSPAVSVSWSDASAYCDWLSSSTRCFSLPTEAEWERAARGDDGASYPWGEEPPSPEVLNCAGWIGRTTAVDSYPRGRSPFGLFNCLGNVWEWCQDWYAEDAYASVPGPSPAGPPSGELRVIRGGSWRSEQFRASTYHRCFVHPSLRSDRHGFRVTFREQGQDVRP